MSRPGSGAERRAWTRFIEGTPALPENKFHAEKTEVNGRIFHSAQEANRAIELQWLESIGEISDLRYQVPYELVPKQGKERPVVYYADFVYRDKTGEQVVEDAKGKRTESYVIKRKLMKWIHKITILESSSPSRAKAARRRTLRRTNGTNRLANSRHGRT